MSEIVGYCNVCDKPATWIRSTQFAGDHPFCSEHAKKEGDFGQSDDSYFYWYEIPADKIAPPHRAEVVGYEGRLPLLAQRIHDLRYDQVAEFYRLTTVVLRHQAENDRANGRVQLADLLDEAAEVSHEQQKGFAKIWTLCEPYTSETT